MAGSNITINKYLRLQFVLIATVAAALLISVYLGAKLPVSENCLIMPRSPFYGESILSAVAKVCLLDILMFWVLTLPWGRFLTLISVFSVFFFRGMVLGCVFRMLVGNSVDHTAVMLYISYAAVTLFSVLYAVIINKDESIRSIYRISACLVATGGCAVIRIIPMLLLSR